MTTWNWWDDPARSGHRKPAPLAEPPEPQERRDANAGDARNEIGHARIRGDVIQARNVAGGVHFHAAQPDPGEPHAVPRQLPADVSTFVNRRPEVRTLTRLIPASDSQSAPRARALTATVVVITGSAGVGKTALALHWAHQVRHRFPDGEIYANLRGFDDSPPVTADLVLDRILRGLGVPPQNIPADLDGRAALFRSTIADRRVLMVFDNVADIGQVRPLIPGSPGPLVVITSRNQLPGLAIRDGARRIRLDIFQESDAVALLRRVTRSGGRQDAPADLTELAQLCARLPLALRVAAEHAVSRPTMRLAELIADLRDDSMLWDALSAGEGPHNEAVRTVFAWSYRELSADAAWMFRVLGLHAGEDISLQAAAAAAGLPPRAARRALDILLGAFLVETACPGRYHLHDLLRAYALDQARTVDSEAERRATIDRVLRWYTATASNATSVITPGGRFPVDVAPVDGVLSTVFADAGAAFEWFDVERANLVANARVARETGLLRRAWELAMVLGPIQANYFMFDDWSALSELAVTAAVTLADPAALAVALDNRGKFLFRRRALEEAKVVHSRALAIREEIGDRQGICQSLNALGLIGLRMRELTAASAYFESIVERARDLGDSRWAGIGRTNLAEAQLESGNAELGLATVRSLTQFFTQPRDPAFEGNAYWLLSWAHRLAGAPAAAASAIESALLIAENAGNRTWEAHWLTEAARVQLALGHAEESMRCCQLSASLQRQIGDSSREATALDCAGEAMLAMGNPEDASAFHREAARIHEQFGDRWQEAIATVHLADCEAALGLTEASREHLAHASTLIERFPDGLALRLLAELRTRLLALSRSLRQRVRTLPTAGRRHIRRERPRPR